MNVLLHLVVKVDNKSDAIIIYAKYSYMNNGHY